LKNLVENGLPTGNIYEYAALMILRYEKKLRTQARKSNSKQAPFGDSMSLEQPVRTELVNSPSPVPGPGVKFSMKEEDKAQSGKKKEDAKTKPEDRKARKDEVKEEDKAQISKKKEDVKLNVEERKVKPDEKEAKKAAEDSKKAPKVSEDKRLKPQEEKKDARINKSPRSDATGSVETTKREGARPQEIEIKNPKLPPEQISSNRDSGRIPKK
jgi:hypothetical protein